MADIADKTRLMALEAKKKMIGEFMRRRQEFQKVRNLEKNISNIKKSLKDLDKAIEAGSSVDVEKDEKELVNVMDNALESLDLVLVDMIYDAHLLKKSLLLMDIDEKKLEKLKAPDGMTKFLKQNHAIALAKIDDTLRNVASLASALATSEE
ncbi:MAG: hypothetical protein KAS15_03070 [Nanoarchaeota archaeon]|nr:hypothetical protein [Nanoarchaeota archaeon]